MVSWVFEVRALPLNFETDLHHIIHISHGFGEKAIFEKFE